MSATKCMNSGELIETFWISESKLDYLSRAPSTFFVRLDSFFSDVENSLCWKGFLICASAKSAL